MDATKTQTPEPGGNAGFVESKQRHNSTTGRRPLKWQRVLEAFVSGRSYNRFQAEHDLHDHCLHSTVATLQGMGLKIERRMESVPGFLGCPTEVMRYWLAPESHQKALALLGRLSPSPGTAGASLPLFDANAEAR